MPRLWPQRFCVATKGIGDHGIIAMTPRAMLSLSRDLPEAAVRERKKLWSREVAKT